MKTGLFYYIRKEDCPQSFVSTSPTSETPFLSFKYIKQIEIPGRRGLAGMLLQGCVLWTLLGNGLTCPGIKPASLALTSGFLTTAPPGKFQFLLLWKPLNSKKKSTHNAGDAGSIPGKIPWRRNQQLTPVFLPGKSHGQRNPAGYGP